MLVLIDESGCPGFKLTKGSTRYFIVVMVVFSNFSEAEKASMAIEVLKRTLNINPEFKFSKTHPSIKDKFFETLCKFDFTVQALVVDKATLYSHKLRNDTSAFYNFFVKTLMHHDLETLQNASIKIDGSGDREFKNALNNYLRKELGQNKIKKFKFVDSEKDNLIQLADMVAGAIARKYNLERKDASRWFEILKKKNKIRNIWDFK